MLKAFLGAFNIKELVGSKKFKTAAVTVVGIVAGWLSIDLPPEVQAEAAAVAGGLIVVVVGIYLHAQGKADAGKAKAEIEKGGGE